jgi:hypothetical protein
MFGPACLEHRTYVFPRHHLYFPAVDLLYPPLGFSHPGPLDLLRGSLRSIVSIEACEQRIGQSGPLVFGQFQGFAQNVIDSARDGDSLRYASASQQAAAELQTTMCWPGRMIW